jgi:hypothetical protein
MSISALRKEDVMKTMKLLLLTLLLTTPVLSEEIVVEKIHGDVSVRHGVTEAWMKVRPGDILRPHDTMKTGEKASAMIVSRREGGNGPAKKIVLPEEVMLDISDIRDLTQEELMLKLTMEKVRASSSQWKDKEMKVTNAPVTHGPDKAPSAPLEADDAHVGVFQWNGAKVLYDNGFYSTCALKAMDIMRRYPGLGERFENRLVVAEALEKANLRGEALQEYVSLSSSGNLTQEQRGIIRSRITELRKKQAE